MGSTFRARILSRFSVAAAAAVSLAAFAADPSGRSGKEVEQSVCFRCHESPASPAPKLGDKNAWIPRLSKGIDALVLSAIRGHGGMPPRGGKAELTDNEIRSAILYMFNPQGTALHPPKAPSLAPPGAQSAEAGGMHIYLGMTSAERMRQFPAGSPEAALNGGVPPGEGYQHVNVTLVDEATNTPVVGARVVLDVEQVGMESHATALEPNRLGGAMSYGAYVKLLPKATYVFHVKVMRPGSGLAIEAKFPQRPG